MDHGEAFGSMVVAGRCEGEGKMGDESPLPATCERVRTTPHGVVVTSCVQ
jgi:hypothetical protein